MKLYMKKLLILFFALFHNDDYAVNNSTTIYSIVGAFVQSDANMLPSLQNDPGNNPVVNALNTTASTNSSAEVGSSLTITGEVVFSGNDVTISVYDSIENIDVVGGVTLNIPVGGTLTVYLDEVLYTDPIHGLNVIYVNSANNFGINAPVTIRGALTCNALAVATITGSLSITAVCPEVDYVSFEVSSGVIASNDIVLNGNSIAWICNNGIIQSTFGNVTIQNNTGTTYNGVFHGGQIITSSSKSVTFQNNISTGYQGVWIDSDGTVQAGTINFFNNIGADDSSGVLVDGILYTNALNVTINCTVSNQSFILNSIVYEYANHAVELASSAITINNTGCLAGTLTVVGDITMSGNNVAITVGTLSDITISNFVVFDVPVGGNLMINGVPYAGTIPGLLVTHGQLAHNFYVQGALVATTVHVAGSVTINAGLTSTNTITITSGSLILPTGAITFNAGGDVAVASGALLSLGSTLTTFTIAGNVSGNGNLVFNSAITPEIVGAIAAKTLTIHTDIIVDGGVVTAGTVSVESGTLNAYGSGLHVTNGDIIVGSGAGLNVGSGGTSVNTSGNIVVADDALSFYSGGVAIDSGNFSIGSGLTSFTISGGDLSVGGSGIVTLNSIGNVGVTLTATTLHIGADQTVSGSVSVTGGSMTIASGATLAASGILYDGLHNAGTYFSNSGTLNTSGGIIIQNANNNDIAIKTGVINAGGNLSILNNACTLEGNSSILITGNISGVDIRINGNSATINGLGVSNLSYNITAAVLLEISSNSSVSGGTAVLMSGGTISAGGGVTISGNNAGTGSSVGVYLGGILTTPSTITMNNNIGMVSGVRIASGGVRTDSTLTITVDDDTAQLFDSSAVTIKRTNGTTVVPFSSFVITVGGVSQGSYPVLNNRVLLAAGNQS